MIPKTCNLDWQPDVQLRLKDACLKELLAQFLLTGYPAEVHFDLGGYDVYYRDRTVAITGSDLAGIVRICLRFLPPDIWFEQTDIGISLVMQVPAHISELRLGETQYCSLEVLLGFSCMIVEREVALAEPVKVDEQSWTTSGFTLGLLHPGALSSILDSVTVNWLTPGKPYGNQLDPNVDVEHYAKRLEEGNSLSAELLEKILVGTIEENEGVPGLFPSIQEEATDDATYERALLLDFLRYVLAKGLQAGFSWLDSVWAGTFGDSCVKEWKAALPPAPAGVQAADQPTTSEMNLALQCNWSGPLWKPETKETAQPSPVLVELVIPGLPLAPCHPDSNSAAACIRNYWMADLFFLQFGKNGYSNSGAQARDVWVNSNTPMASLWQDFDEIKGEFANLQDGPFDAGFGIDTIPWRLPKWMPGLMTPAIGHLRCVERAGESPSELVVEFCTGYARYLQLAHMPGPEAPAWGLESQFVDLPYIDPLVAELGIDDVKKGFWSHLEFRISPKTLLGLTSLTVCEFLTLYFAKPALPAFHAGYDDFATGPLPNLMTTLTDEYVAEPFSVRGLINLPIIGEGEVGLQRFSYVHAYLGRYEFSGEDFGTGGTAYLYTRGLGIIVTNTGLLLGLAVDVMANVTEVADIDFGLVVTKAESTRWLTVELALQSSGGTPSLRVAVDGDLAETAGLSNMEFGLSGIESGSLSPLTGLLGKLYFGAYAGVSGAPDVPALLETKELRQFTAPVWLQLHDSAVKLVTLNPFDWFWIDTDNSVVQGYKDQPGSLLSPACDESSADSGAAYDGGSGWGWGGSGSVLTLDKGIVVESLISESVPSSYLGGALRSGGDPFVVVQGRPGATLRTGAMYWMQMQFLGEPVHCLDYSLVVDYSSCTVLLRRDAVFSRRVTIRAPALVAWESWGALTSCGYVYYPPESFSFEMTNTLRCAEGLGYFGNYQLIPSSGNLVSYQLKVETQYEFAPDFISIPDDSDNAITSGIRKQQGQAAFDARKFPYPTREQFSLFNMVAFNKYVAGSMTGMKGSSTVTLKAYACNVPVAWKEQCWWHLVDKESATLPADQQQLAAGDKLHGVVDVLAAKTFVVPWDMTGGLVGVLTLRNHSGVDCSVTVGFSYTNPRGDVSLRTEKVIHFAGYSHPSWVNKTAAKIGKKDPLFSFNLGKKLEQYEKEKKQ